MVDEVQQNNGEAYKRISNTNLIEATFKHLARINGEINKMNTEQLIEKLKHYNLDINGNDDVRRRRLKNMYRKIKLASININVSSDVLPYYVIIDFEATCQSVNPPDYKHEIIEFPAVLVSTEKLEIIDVFQMYCKPVIHPELSDFCVELTGITQEVVNNAQTFSYVLGHFQNWLRKHNLGVKNKFCIVTDSPLDMSKFLFQQCLHSEVSYPNWAKKWVNIKRSFSSFYKHDRMPLKGMLDYFEMEFEGRLHCGLDDAKNIARILIRMIRDGANIQVNEILTNKKINKFLTQKEHHCPESNSVAENKNVDEDVTNMTEGIKKLKVAANFAVIEKKNRLSTYERIKRQRQEVEAKINREIKEKCRELDFDENVLEWMPPQHIKRSQKHKRHWRKFPM